MADEKFGLAKLPGQEMDNNGVGTFVYDDVGPRMGQGQMSPRPREKKGRRVGPFPVTTDTTGKMNYESGKDDE